MTGNRRSSFRYCAEKTCLFEDGRLHGTIHVAGEVRQQGVMGPAFRNAQDVSSEESLKHPSVNDFHHLQVF